MVSFVMFHVDEHKCDVAISGFADAPDIVATAGQLQLPVLALCICDSGYTNAQMADVLP